MSPLFAKLNLKADTDVIVLNAPPSFEPELGRLPGVAVHRSLTGRKPVRFALAFATHQMELDKLAKQLCAKADGDAVLWFAYPKKTSKRFACDFNRDTGWTVLRDAGYDSVRMVAIDDDWSALRFRKVEHIKTTSTRTTATQGAQTK